MAQVLKLKRSAVAGRIPQVADLQLGEVAVNTFDGKMYMLKNDGSPSVVDVSAGGDLSLYVLKAGDTMTGQLTVHANISAGNSGAGYDIVDVTSTNGVDVRLQAQGSSNIGSVGTQSAHPFYLYTNNSERVRIGADGKVGIGTSVPQNSLSVVGAMDVSGPAVIGGAGVGFQFLGIAPGQTMYYKIATLPPSTDGTNDHINIYAQNNDNWGGAFNRELHMMFGNRGGFVARYFSLLGGTPTGAAKIACYAEADGSTSVYAITVTGFYCTLTVDVRTSIDVTIYPGAVGSPIVGPAAPTGTLIFDSSTAIPAYNVDGLDVPTPGFSIQSGAAAHTSTGHATGASDGASFATFYYNGTLVGNIAQVGTTATAYNTTSDQRRKENIVSAPPAGSTIDAMQVRSFDWKSDGSHVDYGFVAQELAPIVPGAVTVGGDDPDTQPWAVDYSKLVPVLVKEIQDLRARIAALEAK